MRIAYRYALGHIYVKCAAQCTQPPCLAHAACVYLKRACGVAGYAHGQSFYLLINSVGLTVCGEEQIELFYGLGICHKHGKRIINHIHSLAVDRLISAQPEVGAVIYAPCAAVGLIVYKKYRHNIAGCTRGNVFDGFRVYRFIQKLFTRLRIDNRRARACYGIAHATHHIYVRLYKTYTPPC